MFHLNESVLAPQEIKDDMFRVRLFLTRVISTFSSHVCFSQPNHTKNTTAQN